MKLTDICDFQGGSQPPKDGWSFDEQDGYVRMLQIRDFTQSERVTPEYIKISNSTKMCEADDILIARYGASIGKILTGLAGAYNVAIMRTIPDTSKIKKKYLYYYLKSSYFQNAIINVGSRAAQAGFNKEDLSKLDIECPELAEQDGIVNILEKVEAIIEKRKEELSSLDDLIKARFVEMFGDLFKNNKGWKEMPLGKTCDKVVRYPTFYGMDYLEQGTRVIRIGNILPDGHMDLVDANYVFVYENVNDDFPETVIEKNDIVMAVRGDGSAAKRIGIVTEEELIGANISPNLIRIKANPDILNPVYLFFYLTGEIGQMRLDSYVNKTAKKNIAAKDIVKVIVPVPHLELQNEYAKFVAQVNKSKVVVKQAHDKAQLLFDSLMQKYFG